MKSKIEYNSDDNNKESDDEIIEIVKEMKPKIKIDKKEDVKEEVKEVKIKKEKSDKQIQAIAKMRGALIIKREERLNEKQLLKSKLQLKKKLIKR